MWEDRSTRFLAITIAVFFFTSSLSGTFLPIYLRDIGLSVFEIILVLFLAFLVMGLLPLVLIRVTRHFERIINAGILLTLLFYVALIYVKNPFFLGLAYGVSIATFWPSFNLLMFRLSEAKERAQMMSLFQVVIPSITSVVSPAVGGFVAETLGFVTLFVISILLYLVSFIVSLKIHCKPETQAFSIPRNRIFLIFLVAFILLGLSEAYWLAYPLFVLTVSETILNTGLVLAASSLVISFVTFAISRLSDIKRIRVEFAVVSSVLYALWCFVLPTVSTMVEIVMLSLLSGFAGAFMISWFAHYGDSFGRKYHASILVVMEVGLMMGRILNLIPSYYFIPSHYTRYFVAVGLVSLPVIPFYILSKK